MATLFKRSNGVYYFTYAINGKRRWKSTGETQKPLALKYLIDFIGISPETPVRIILSTFIEDFLSSAVSNFSPGTVGIYKQALKKFLSIIGDVQLNSITPKHVDNYKTERLKNISPVTLNIELRTLRAAFNIALKWKAVEFNPFDGMKLIRVPEQLPTFFSKADFQKLISIIKEGWLREMIILAVLTGMRRGELANLKWKDIDFHRKLISIQSSPTFKTKQGKCRAIPLSDVALHLLSGKQQHSKGDYVFSLKGGKILEGWISHKFVDSGPNLPLNPVQSCHLIRSKVAT